MCVSCGSRRRPPRAHADSSPALPPTGSVLFCSQEKGRCREAPSSRERLARGPRAVRTPRPRATGLAPASASMGPVPTRHPVQRLRGRRGRRGSPGHLARTRHPSLRVSPSPPRVTKSTACHPQLPRVATGWARATLQPLWVTGCRTLLPLSSSMRRTLNPSTCTFASRRCRRPRLSDSGPDPAMRWAHGGPSTRPAGRLRGCQAYVRHDVAALPLGESVLWLSDVSNLPLTVSIRNTM